jgi:hypothetical protein
MFARSDCRAGGIIFRFDCDDYVKFFRRIVKSLDCRQQLVDNTRFTAERGDE